MGLFQKAVETYDAMEHLAGVFEEGREVLAPVGHIIATARIEITVDADGNFIRAKNIEEKIPIPCTEKSSGRAGLLPPAHPLCDKAKYVTENDDQKHHLYLEELKSWAESGYSSPKLQAVYQYVKSGHVLADLLDAGVVSCDSSGILKQKDDIITWRVEGLQEDSGAVYKDKQLMRQFMQYYLKVIPHKTNVCMISGNKEQIAQQREQFVKDSIAAVNKKNAEEKKVAQQQKAVETAVKDTTALFHAAMSGNAQDIVLKNEKLSLTLSTQGGTVKKAIVNNYKGHNITKNGKGDLAVMSIEAYERLQGKLELYSLIEQGMEDVRSGNVRPLSEALSDIRKGLE